MKPSIRITFDEQAQGDLDACLNFAMSKLGGLTLSGQLLASAAVHRLAALKAAAEVIEPEPEPENSEG